MIDLIFFGIAIVPVIIVAIGICYLMIQVLK